MLLLRVKIFKKTFNAQPGAFFSEIPMIKSRIGGSSPPMLS
jgi:hypothetical protein